LRRASAGRLDTRLARDFPNPSRFADGTLMGNAQSLEQELFPFL